MPNCRYLYQDQVFETPEDLQKYGEDNDISEIKDAFKQPEIKSNEFYQQEDNSYKIPPDKELNKTLTNFLNKRGWSINVVDNIKDENGKPLSVVAKADMMSKLIEVVENRANQSTLPEETSHVAINMLGDTLLLKDMMSKITDYSLYKDTLDEYKKFKAYRNEDGSLNLDKIKKEAIAKLVTDYIIKGNTGEESESNITKAKSWWDKVIDYIKNLFSKEPGNPFKEVSNAIMQDDPDHIFKQSLKDEGEYYQTDRSLDDLERDQDKIKLDNSIDPKTGQKRHVYTYDDIPVKSSVTQAYVDPWLKKIFKSNNFTEKEKEVNLVKAEVGDVIHDEIDGIVKSWTDKDGLLNDTQAVHSKQTSDNIYDKLNTYVQQVLTQFPEGTIFKTEQKVFDKKNNIAGSVDFMAITPDGKVNILDWKTQEIFKGQEELKAHKPDMYRIQLQNYQKILREEYGFQDFGMIRAIPMRVGFDYDRSSGSITGVKGIELGDVNPANIPDTKNYLLPVALKEEETGNSKIDKLLVKLNGIKQKIQDKRISRDESYKKHEELKKVNNAIRDLQLKSKVEGLINLGLTEFDKYNEKMKAKSLNGKDIQEAKQILQVFSKSGSYILDLLKQMHSNAKEDENIDTLKDYNILKDRFLSMSARTGNLLIDLQEYNDEAAVNLAKPYGFEKLLDAEAPIGPINGIFSDLSKITQKTFQTFYKTLRVARNISDSKFEIAADRLSKIRQGFLDHISKNGLDHNKGLDKILDIDKEGKRTGNFLKEFKPEFYSEKNRAIEEGDKKWLIDNLVFDPDKKYEAQEKNQIDFYKSFKYSSDPVKNEEQIQKSILNFKKNYSLLDNKGVLNEQALFNPHNYFLQPTENWHTDKWIELNKPENKALKDTYDFFQEQNRYTEKLGMLDRKSPWFIPSIYASKIDHLAFGDMKGALKNDFFKKLEVDSGTQYTPETDPTDGRIINRVPVYFTGTIDPSDRSYDLFKVYGLWSKHMYNYEAMADIEDTAMILLEAEKNKKSLKTDTFGRIKIENGKVQTIENNDKNGKLLEDWINFYLYDKRTGLGADVDFTNPFNGKVYSLQKTISAAQQWYGFKTLALNPLSGTSNFVGGTGNALFLAQKGIFFNTKDWAKAMYLSVSDKTSKSAVRWANIYQEDAKSHVINELALNSLSKTVSMDHGYAIQRYTDMAVETPIAVAMMLNHMVVDGKIVDINKYVKDKYNYSTTFYDLSKADRNSVMQKIDQEVEELKNNNSLLKTGVLDTDGKFTLSEIDKASETMEAFRSKIKGVIKKAIGNTSHEDISLIRTSLLGMSLMQFRSWIPAMVEERFGGFKYIPELDTHTLGKTNLLFSEIFSKRMPQLAKAIITGLGDNAIKSAEAKYFDMQRKAFEKGQDFNITKTEFTDLYIGNLRSQMMEMGTLLGFAAAVFSATGGGSSNDKDFNGVKKYMNRALKRYYNEFSFYYLPTSFTELIKSPIPMIGLAEDVSRFTTAFAKTGYGEITGNEKMVKDANAPKYFVKMIPVAKEIMMLISAHDDDFRKEWGVKIN